MPKYSRKTKSLVDVSDRHFRRLVNNLADGIINTNVIHETINLPLIPSHNNDLLNSDPLEVNSPSELCEFGQSNVVPLDVSMSENVEESVEHHQLIVDGNCSRKINNHINDDENSSASSNNINCKTELICWATKHKIKHNALSDLLVILRTYGTAVDLPKDSRTLLRTPRKTLIRDVAPGSYHHFSIASTLHEVLQLDYQKYKFTSIPLIVGIDGLPLSESNSSQLWPILGAIFGTPRVFLIGAYHGYKKPHDSNQYLEEFVHEMTYLINNGLLYDGKRLEVSLRAVICDAPAKSFISKTKGHSGYFSCSKCTQEGVYDDSRICFPKIVFEKRTDESFLAQTNEEFHQGISVLTNIPNFGMVTRIPLDYMHLVCIGVVKKTIHFWLKGNLNVRLPSRQVNILSEKLVYLRPFITSEFARRPQEINTYSNWKATELRQFLLYTSPVVLYKILPNTLYHHFMTLHVAIRQLCVRESSRVCSLDYVQKILEHFVDSFIKIYGVQFVSHNVHGLLHLVDDVKLLGPLDSFSAFPFENHMRILKSFLQKPDKPLQQLHRRYEEKNSANMFECLKARENLGFLKVHNNGPLFFGYEFDKQYKQYKTSQWELTIKEPNNCCMINKTVIEVLNFAYCYEYRSHVVIGKQFKNVDNIFDKPCPSSHINCVYVTNLSETIDMWVTSDITNKCVKLPFKDGFAVFPLLHGSSGVAEN